MSDESTAGDPTIHDTRRAAERYLHAGLAVIPIPAGEKNPNRRDWQTERHGVEDVHRLWPNGEGIGALWGEPSGGLVDIEADWPEAQAAAPYILPRRRTWGRPGSPESHHVVRIVGDGLPKTKRYPISGKDDDRMVGELLSTGAQSLLPPSLHSSGERRRWYKTEPAIELTATEAREAAADIVTAAWIARNWPGQGARKHFCMAAAGYIGRRLPRARAERVMEGAIHASGDEEARSRMVDVKDTLDDVEADNPTTGGPVLDELAPGVVKQLEHWHRWSAKRNGSHKRGGGGGHHDDPPPTDDELRDRFFDAYPDLAFGLGDWRQYENGVWQATDELAVKDGVCRVLEQAKSERVRPTRNLLGSVLELARVRSAVPADKWDADPAILVCRNGAVNLETRERMPHDKKHYATAGVDYDYDEDAVCEVWEQQVMGLVAEHLGLETVSFIQEFAGYATTTRTEHEIALWFTGKHGGGRSTILEGLRAMLGPRCGVLSLSDIERSSFALTDLPGKTLVTATEQPAIYVRGGGVANAIISGEEIVVDRKYRDAINIIPRAKIAWALNELPKVGNADDGLFRRVYILELPEIPPADRDPQVKETVKRSGAAILNWSLDGLERLNKRGKFAVPEKVRGATADFKETSDVSAMFVAEACTKSEGFSVMGQRLYDTYKGWCLDNGHKHLASNNAAKEWRRLGFRKEHTKTGARWHGLKVRQSAYDRYSVLGMRY
jgi:P4 family phage/plasmid primase-like protien